VSDVFTEYYRRKDQIEHQRRKDLSRRYGKKCKQCGGTEMVAAPDAPAGRKPCPSCKFRRRTHGKG